MKLSSLSALLLLCLIFVARGKDHDTNKLLVGSEITSPNAGEAECSASVVHCQEGHGGPEETTSESEDYIYTQSLP
ncbi:hypothetical protein NMG60_11007232 [Bertholletia excelsa]